MQWGTAVGLQWGAMGRRGALLWVCSGVAVGRNGSNGALLLGTAVGLQWGYNGGQWGAVGHCCGAAVGHSGGQWCTVGHCRGAAVGLQWGAMGGSGALLWGCNPISAAVGSLQDSKRFGAHIRGALMDIAALLGAPQQ